MIWDRVHGLTVVGNQSSGAVNRIPPWPPWARHMPCQLPLIPSLILGRVLRGPITSARFFNRRDVSTLNRVVSDSITQGVPFKYSKDARVDGAPPGLYPSIAHRKRLAAARRGLAGQRAEHTALLALKTQRIRRWGSRTQDDPSCVRRVTAQIPCRSCLP